MQQIKNNNEFLRSEKVRQLIGNIPTSLVRWSIVIIVIVAAILILVICLLLNPYNQDESPIMFFFNRILKFSILQ